jgi:hypothetical protein
MSKRDTAAAQPGGVSTVPPGDPGQVLIIDRHERRAAAHRYLPAAPATAAIARTSR